MVILTGWMLYNKSRNLYFVLNDNDDWSMTREPRLAKIFENKEDAEFWILDEDPKPKELEAIEVELSYDFKRK